MVDTALARLCSAIEARFKRRGLTADLNRLRYANGYTFDRSNGPTDTVLYVGVGHGLDAVLALLDGDCRAVIGVDPYKWAQGNDDTDYGLLCDLIRDLGLGDRFALHRCTIEDYLTGPVTPASRIICNDVLHHIFSTQERLRETNLFDEVKALFCSLQWAATQHAALVISDVSKTGLRPLLVQYGLLRSHVRHRSKQNWREWDAALAAAGWRRERLVDYVPYRLRHLRVMISSPLARYTILTKYFAMYRLG